MLLHILDDNARLGYDAISIAVVQDRNFSYRPAFDMSCCRAWIRKVDEAGLKRNIVLVERNQNLMAKRGERMQVRVQVSMMGLLLMRWPKGWGLLGGVSPRQWWPITICAILEGW